MRTRPFSTLINPSQGQGRKAPRANVQAPEKLPIPKRRGVRSEGAEERRFPGAREPIKKMRAEKPLKQVETP
jgi:hypothetical protein